MILRGEVAFIDGEVLVKPGSGQDVRMWSQVYTYVVLFFTPDNMMIGLSWSTVTVTQTK